MHHGIYYATTDAHAAAAALSIYGSRAPLSLQLQSSTGYSRVSILLGPLLQ